MGVYRIHTYVLTQAHALTDSQAPPATNTLHQIHTKCLMKHQKIVQKHSNSSVILICLAVTQAQIATPSV